MQFEKPLRRETSMCISNSRMPHGVIILIASLSLSACMGKNYRPVIDPKGVNMSYYEADLAECQNIAGQQSVIAESAQTAVVGAAAGAVVGSVIGAFFGDAGEVLLPAPVGVAPMVPLTVLWADSRDSLRW